MAFSFGRSISKNLSLKKNRTPAGATAMKMPEKYLPPEATDH
jgi:hypothetical protein